MEAFLSETDKINDILHVDIWHHHNNYNDQNHFLAHMPNIQAKGASWTNTETYAAAYIQ